VEGGGRRAHGGEPGAAKKRLRLGETRRTPAAVKAEVLALVQRTHERSGWAVTRILRALGLARTVFYAWQARAATDALADRSPRAPRTAQLFPEERAAIVQYAEAHPGEGYRRLAWQMVDAQVVAASPSAVYDVLKAAGRLYRPAPEPGSGRKPPAPTRPDQRWHVDVLYLWVLGRWYFLVTIIDAYSRYIVQWELCWTLTGDAMALVLQAALDTTPGATPEVVSDNGPEFINRDFVTVLKAQGLKQIRTRFYHPESNGVLERYHRTFREEGWGQAPPANYPAAQALIGEWVTTYNTTRLHSALHYLPPAEYYRGAPEARLAERRAQLQAARHRRRDAWAAYAVASRAAEGGPPRPGGGHSDMGRPTIVDSRPPGARRSSVSPHRTPVQTGTDTVST
jgi:transposase InsO family protein